MEHFPGLLLGKGGSRPSGDSSDVTFTDLDLGASLWGPEELPAACSLTSFGVYVSLHYGADQYAAMAQTTMANNYPRNTTILDENMTLKSGVT